MYIIKPKLFVQQILLGKKKYMYNNITEVF